MMDRTEVLVRGVQSGSDEAIRELLVRYLPEVHAFIRLRLGPKLQAKESSADVVQSVCREVLQDLHAFDYRGESEFRAWLFLAAQRKLADRGRFYGRMRRDGPGVQSLSQAEITAGYRNLLSPSEAAIRQEEVSGLERAFAVLPEDYREALMLAKFLHLSPEEVGERMGRSTGAARNLIHRAVARLALVLDEGASDVT